MRSNFRIILTFFLLLLLVSLTATAEDAIHPRGCRRANVSVNKSYLRRAPQIRKPGGDFYKGSLHQLVILASFNDCTFKDSETATIEQWDNIFNHGEVLDSPFIGSVRDYFYSQSYSQFDPQFDLHYVNVGKRSRYASTKDDDENTKYLVSDIVDSLLKRNIDWSIYDWNGDGYINQLLIVFAGKGSSHGGFGGGYDAIWPNQGWLSDRVDFSPIVVDNNYLVDCYCAVQELYIDDGYGTFGTICHEYSHCFGFPDFYFGGYKYVGNWDLMDNGNYNCGGYIPCGYSAHERMLMGWLELSELKEAKTISDMEALSDKGEAYLIRNDGYENEYYIIENRQQEGWDQGVPNSGILVFHVDYEPEVWISIYEPPNHPEFEYQGVKYQDRERYRIFNPKKSYYNYGWPYPYDNINQLTNTSTPIAETWHANTDSQNFMNKSIVDMAVADGLASFTFKPTPTAEQAVRQKAIQSDGVWYNLSGQRIAVPASSVSLPHKGVFICNGKKYVR